MLRPSGFIISRSFRRHCSFTSSTTAVAVSVAKLLPRHFQRASLQHCCLPSSSRSRRRGLFVVAAFVLATTSSSTFGPTTSVVRAYSSFGSSSSMSFITERTGGDGGIITVSPKDESKQSALVVISHGLGDTSEGFADVAEHLAKEMPYCKFILPTAPTQPVTMNMGMSMPSWYDIVGLDERSNENCAGIERSVQTLRDILEKEHVSTNLPYSRMVLMGFSQGGALSLYTGLQKEEQKLAGIVLLSGYLPHASAFNIAPGLEDTPVFHGHGTQDMLVKFSFQEKTKRHVIEKGLQPEMYTTKSYPIAHTVSPSEIADVLQFLKTILPDDETCRIAVKDPTEMSVKELKAAIKRAGLQQKAIGLMEKSEFVRLLQDHRSGL